MSTKILLDAIQAVITDCYYAGEHENNRVALSIGNAFETFKQEIEMRLEEAGLARKAAPETGAPDTNP